MKVKIEKNVPIPDRSSSEWNAVFSSMQPGDSFFTEVSPSTVRNRLNNYRRRFAGASFVTQIVEEKDSRGLRVWRTK